MVPLFFSARSTPIVKFLMLAVSLIAICFLVFIPTAWFLKVKSLDFIAPNAAPVAADVTFSAEMISADPIARTFVMNWYALSAHSCASAEFLDVVDIYLDPGFLDVSSPSFSTQPPYRPAIQINFTETCGQGPGMTPIFQTVSRLLPFHFDGDSDATIPVQSSLQNYPFDVYFVQFFLYARKNESGSFFPVNVTRSFGVAVNFQVTLERSIMFVSDQLQPQLLIILQVERSAATKMFVVLIAVANWLITIAFVTISAATFIYHPHEIYSEMFVLPVATLFAFTSVRANLPGAPVGFGATIDLYSILPALVVMSLCSFFLLITILVRRLDNRGKNKETNAPSQSPLGITPTQEEEQEPAIEKDTTDPSLKGV